MSSLPERVRRRELGGPDPLDRTLRRTPSAVDWLVTLLRTRSALGLAPSLTPAIVYLPIGFLLGPSVLGVLSDSLLGHLDVAIAMALTLLGAFVGIGVAREMRTAVRLLVAASIESAATVALVTAGTMYLVSRTGVPLTGPLVAVALAFGLGASASSATSADPRSEPAAAVATRVADLDDVLPILVCTIAFVLLAPPGASVWRLALAPVAIGLGAGGLGWLLFERAESTADRVVFVLGVLALAGGGAAYASVSALEVGLIAGVVWTVSPGRADRIVQDDLAKLQHPLVVLLLLVAGALFRPSAAVAWLLAPFLLMRLAGKILGAGAAVRVLGDVRTSDMTAFLLPPGVLGVALALNFRQVLDAGTAGVLVSTVAFGTAAFELFALAVMPVWRRGGAR